MAEKLSPEESAKRILSIMVEDHSSKAGQGVQFQVLQSGFTEQGQGPSNDEFADGLKYAGDKDWIETGPNNFVLLTQAGFDEA